VIVADFPFLPPMTKANLARRNATPNRLYHGDLPLRAPHGWPQIFGSRTATNGTNRNQRPCGLHGWATVGRPSR
jgi:hypothetical protein